MTTPDRSNANHPILTDAERLWAQTFDATRDAIWIIDTDQRILRCNRTAEEMFNRPAKEMIGKHCWEIVHGTDCRTPDCPYPRSEKSHCRESMELEADGRWFEVTVDPILDADGSLSSAVHIVRDITDRKLVVEKLRESEERLRLITAASSEDIWQLDRQGRVIYASSAVFDIFGYTQEEALHLGFDAFFDPIDLPRAQQTFLDALQGKEYQLLELSGRTKMGENVPIEVSVMPMIRDQEVVGVQGIARDITERKATEQRLRDSRAFNETLLNSTPDTIYIYDLVEKRNIYSSQSIGRVLGYTVEEIQSMGAALIETLMEPDDLKRYVAEILPQYQSAADGEFVEHQYRMLHKDGSWRWLLSKESIFNRQDDGTPRQIFGVISDVTIRQNALGALQASAEKYRLLFENMLDAFALHRIVVDSQGAPVDYEFLEVNSAFERLTQLRREDILGSRVTDVLPEIKSDPADWIGKYGEVAVTGKETRFEQFSRDLDRWYSVLAFSPQEGQFATIFQDITERKRATQALKESEQRFRTAGQASYDLIYEWDATTDSLEWFGDIDGLLGFKQGEISRDISAWLNLIHPDDRGQMANAVEEHRTSTEAIKYAYRIRTKDGAYLYWDDHALPLLDEQGKPAKWVGACTDLTKRMKAEDERLSLEAQLRQAQKLESIGTLASGVAHEVNNPLMGMINYAELIKDRIQHDAQSLEYAKEIIHEGNRIATIVKNLLAFSRQDEAGKSLVGIQEVVDDALLLMNTVLRTDQIRVTTDIPADLPDVRCRNQQIQQVLVNLLTNAQGALNERYPDYDEDKILTISAEVIERDRSWLRITVEDHGIGVPDDLKDRVFDPFFTSKTRDQGTGLGLSVSHGIVKDHGGRLTFDSTVGEFTRFHVDLPLPTS